MNLDKAIKILESKNTELNLTINNYKSNKDKIEIVKETILNLEKIQKLVIDVGQQSQQNVIGYMEKTITLALQSIFGEEYSFKIVFEMKRDQPECHFYVNKNGLLLEPRSDTMGGGIIDVAALALHVLVLILEKSPPILIADEPMLKNVSKEHLPAVADMLKKLIKELNIQLIMVTHIPELIEIADNVIEISKECVNEKPSLSKARKIRKSQ